jgi:phosphoglycerate kinase
MSEGIKSEGIKVKTLDDLIAAGLISGKKVLMRVDFNVPINNGKIESDIRIQAALPSIKKVLDANGKLILSSHLGRPKEGEFDESASLAPVAAHLSDLINIPVRIDREALNSDPACVKFNGNNDENNKEVILLGNVRFNKGEKDNSDDLAKKMAQLCDVYVHDAFGTAHRAQASTHGVAKYAKIVCAGPLLMSEIKALEKSLSNPKRPLVAIVGGSKVSSKLTVLKELSNKVDQLIVGGGIANTFLAAKGFNVGKSLYEKDLISDAKDIINNIESKGGVVPLPVDVRVAKEFDINAKAEIKSVDSLDDDDQILDVGPKSSENLSSLVLGAGTIVWNGPIGVFEFPEFSQGTKSLALDVAKSDAFSIAGGGDTLSAIDQFGVKNKISYISTGGGAFLEYLEGKELPALSILKQRYED